MVIDFSKINLKDPAVLILKNLDGTAIGVLGCAYNIKVELNYNEVSTLSFTLPKYVDGEATPGYSDVIGTRIVDLMGWGQFLLVDPERENDGVRELKTCKAYSLEYEFTKKKLTLEEQTYNFWNPTVPAETILSIILEYMPSWSVGQVDEALYGVYRTFSVSGTNLYDFIKNTVQKSYGCIFEFDTYERKVHVRAASSDVPASPVLIALENLATKLQIKEDSDSIVTALDVNGADGVDIRSVNPLGTNKIYNLDYFMNTSHFSQQMVDKWNAWRAAVESNRQIYYDLNIQRMLAVAEELTLQNAIGEKKSVSLASLENARAVRLEYLAGLEPEQLYVGIAEQGTDEPTADEYARQPLVMHCTEGSDAYEISNATELVFRVGNAADWDSASRWAVYRTERGTSQLASGMLHAAAYQPGEKTVRITAGYIGFSWSKPLAEREQSTKEYLGIVSQISDLNDKIAEMERTITQMDSELYTITSQKDALTAQIREINRLCAMNNYFTDDELLILDRYFIEDSISESSFVIGTAKSYVDDDMVVTPEGTARVRIAGGSYDKTEPAQGRAIYDAVGGVLSVPELNFVADLVRCTVERKQSASSDSFVLAAFVGAGHIGEEQFVKGTVTIRGQVSALSDDAQADSETPSVSHGSQMDATLDGMQLYFTQNPTEYEQYSVEWDLYEYGVQVLRKLAWPSYTFTVDSANFFALDEFSGFAKKTALGRRMYLKIDKGEVLTPILTGVTLEFENLPSLVLTFGSSYSGSDNAFQLVDLLQQSVSMGRSVDTGRFSYNAFINSSASTAVKAFMDSALDTAKNAILSTAGVEISWDSSGFHARKSDDNGGYEPEQIAIVNNSILFTDNNWQSAKMAIGKFKDQNLGESWGIVAPSIVGTLLAGQNLVIESQKQDGGVSVFRVDGSGALLHNARFDIEDGTRHIILDPEVGFVIGTYPVTRTEGGQEVVDVGTTDDPGNARFWVDPDGNVHFRGTLDGASGTFSGTVQASDFLDANGNSMLVARDGKEKFAADYLDLHGITVKDANNQTTFSVDQNGNVTFAGTLNGANGTFNGTVQAADYLDADGNSMLVNSEGTDKFASDYLDLHGLTVTDANDNVTFSVDQNGNVVFAGTLNGASGTFSGTVSWEREAQYPIEMNNIARGSVSFSVGSDGVSRTDLLTLDSNRGMWLTAMENIKITPGPASKLWIEAMPSEIMVLDPNGSGSFVTLGSLL